MKNYQLWTILFVISVFLTSCNALASAQQDAPTHQKQYNICLVLDGTDRLSEENGVPCVPYEEMVNLANTLTEKGTGNLYVSYVDNNCDNNRVAVFEWSEMKPSAPGNKPDYMKMAKYNELVSAYEEAQGKYSSHLEESIRAFSHDCSCIEKMAYSDVVAHQKKGSDVNGAINQADRLLRASAHGDNHPYIILVSDGCDNVGKELAELTQGTEILLVNSNVAKHQYGNLISREFVTLDQAINYIFN